MKTTESATSGQPAVKNKTKKRKGRGDGQGSVFQLKTGQWRAQLPYRKADGRRAFRTRAFPTKREAQDWLTKELYDRSAGTAIAPDKQTVGEFLDKWLKAQERQWSPKTARTYSDLVALHLKPELGHISIQKLDTPTVQFFLNRKAEALAPKTVKHLRDTLRAALNVAIEWQLISKNAASKARGPKDREPSLRVLSREEARQFLNSLHGHRDGPMFRLMLSLGLRKGEMLGLMLSDLALDAETPSVHIRRTLQAVGGKIVVGPPKSRSSVRRLPLSPAMAAVLRVHLQNRARLKAKNAECWQETEHVFVTSHGTPIYPRNVNRKLAATLKIAGIPHLRVHDLRHSAATFAVADSVPGIYVQEMLGHSNISTTMNVYAKVMSATLEHATSTLERILEPVTDLVTDEKTEGDERKNAA
jgi:integrase